MMKEILFNYFSADNTSHVNIFSISKLVFLENCLLLYAKIEKMKFFQASGRIQFPQKVFISNIQLN